MNTSKYKSQVEMGERYVDDQTGFEGIVTSVTFFQYACERVALETYDATTKSVKVEVFDAPRLTKKGTTTRLTSPLTGGPGDPLTQRAPLAR